MRWIAPGLYAPILRSQFTKEQGVTMMRQISPVKCRNMRTTLLSIAALLTFASVMGADLNPAALSSKLPNQIKWVDSPSGSSQAVLVGDPAKPGLYIVLTKWSPHHMSRPHFHPNDRFVTVISGTLPQAGGPASTGRSRSFPARSTARWGCWA